MAFENPLKNLGKIGKAQPQQPMQSVEQPPMTPMQPQIQSPMTPMQPQIQSPMTPASVGGFNIQREIEDIRNKYTGMTPQQIVPQQQANIPGVDTSIGGIAGVNTPTISPTLQKPEFQKAYAPEFQKQMQGRDTMFGYLPGGISETKKAVIDFQTQGMDQGQRQEFMNQQSPLRPGGETEIKPDVAPVIQDTLKQALETMPEFEGQQITPQVINMVMQNPEIKNLFLQEMPEAFQNATPTFEGTLDRIQQQSQEFKAPIVGPLVRGASNLLVGTVKSVDEGIGGIKNIAMKIGGQDTGTTLSEDVFDTVEGGTTALFNVFAPYLALGANVAAQTGPGERALNGLSSLMTTGGEYINKTPGLRQFKDSLPEEDQQRFDTFVGSSIVALLGGTKGKTELLKKRSTAELKNFIKTNANPVNIIKNFQENVLNLPKELVKGSKKIKDINITEPTANLLMKTATPQDKLFKAQSPTLNVLNKNRDFKALRRQSDRANQLIIDEGFMPTDTTSRAELHHQTMKNIWSRIEEKIENKEDIMVDQRQFADIIDNIVTETKRYATVKNQPDLKALMEESADMKKNPIISIPDLEKKKQLINGIVNNRGDSQIGDVYKNGMKQVTRAIGEVEDTILSKLPQEFSNLKKDFGTLKATYEDVLKADLKNQKAKGMGLIESYSRIEGLGDIIGGTISMSTKAGQGLIDVGKGFGKVFLGKALKKATDPDFLVEQGFKDLGKTIKNDISSPISRPIIPTLPRKGALNTQQALPSPSTVTPSNIGTPRNPIVGPKPIVPKKDIVELPAKPKNTVNIKKPIIKKIDSPINIDEIFSQLEDPKVSIPYLRKTIPAEEKKLVDFKKDPNNYTPLMVIKQQKLIDRMKKELSDLTANQNISSDTPIIKKFNSIIDTKKYNRLEKLLENEDTVIGKDMSEADFQDYHIEKYGRMAPKYDTFEKRVSAVEKEGGEFNINLTDRANKLFKGKENASKIEDVRSIYNHYTANQKVSPKPTKPLIKKKEKVQSDTLSDGPTEMKKLYEEARKYKTVDEFIDNFQIKKQLKLSDGLQYIDNFTLGKGIKSNENVSKLKESILNAKEVSPIEITKDGFIVDGEHRYKALKELGVKKIPVFVGEQDGSIGKLKKPYPGIRQKIDIPKISLKQIREEANKK